jgi:hypothetical protein
MRARKLLATLTATLALLLGVIAAPPAQAANNGSHYHTLTCTSGGTSISGTISYTVSGVGNSAQNEVHGTLFNWWTTPGALLNRISISVDGNSDGVYVQQLNTGGSVSTLNDVPAVGDNPTDWWATFAEGDPGHIRMQVWGGVGNSTDTCWRSETLA